MHGPVVGEERIADAPGLLLGDDGRVRAVQQDVERRQARVGLGLVPHGLVVQRRGRRAQEALDLGQEGEEHRVGLRLRFRVGRRRGRGEADRLQPLGKLGREGDASVQDFGGGSPDGRVSASKWIC